MGSTISMLSLMLLVVETILLVKGAVGSGLGVGGFGDRVVCGMMLDALSLFLVVMFVLSGFCCTIPEFRMRGVK